MTEEKSANFLEEIIEKDLEAGKYKSIITRFPPEPNGYLHMGHAKSICLNFGLALKYGGETNLRFDDTNPVTEETEYVDGIKNDIKWLGFHWSNEFYASDYFEKLYDFAVTLIKNGLEQPIRVCFCFLPMVRKQFTISQKTTHLCLAMQSTILI